MPTFKFEGKDIFYKVQGEGKPILILNGIMMSTASWNGFAAELTRQNQLICVDLLDQGQSAKMTEPFTLHIQAEVVKALCNHLGLSKIYLMGTSYGGEVALQFVLRYQDYVERLILFNTVSYTSAWMQEIGEAWNAAIDNPHGYYAVTIPVIYSPNYYERQKEWMAKRKDLLTKTAFANKDFLNSMVRLTNSVTTHDVRCDLHKITVPTLVVGSECDHITPPEEQRFIAEHMPNASLVLLPNTGHAAFYERPCLFTTLLLGFVNLESLTYKV